MAFQGGQLVKIRKDGREGDKLSLKPGANLSIGRWVLALTHPPTSPLGARTRCVCSAVGERAGARRWVARQGRRRWGRAERERVVVCVRVRVCARGAAGVRGAGDGAASSGASYG